MRRHYASRHATPRQPADARRYAIACHAILPPADAIDCISLIELTPLLTGLRRCRVELPRQSQPFASSCLTLFYFADISAASAVFSPALSAAFSRLPTPPRHASHADADAISGC